MKKIVLISIITVMVLSTALSIALAGKGNDLPSGQHYNLNLIASKEKNIGEGDTPGHGHRIFVRQGGNTRILLTEGPFDVIDYDGTDGVAKFQLPHPDEDETPDDQWTVSDYSVYIRIRGKPGGEIRMQTVGIDDRGVEYGSDYTVVEVRTVGKNKPDGHQKFNNVSKELLYIYAWVYDWNKEVWEYVRLPLFDERLETYLWDVNTNDKFKIAQLRFYPYEETDIPPVDPGPAPTDPPIPPG
jgi:hypothetical protein